MTADPPSPRPDVLDEPYDPPLALRARLWIEPFLTSCSEVVMRPDERGQLGLASQTRAGGQ